MKIIYGNTYEIAKSYADFFINNLKIKQKFDYDDNYEQILISINQTNLFDNETKFNYLINHANFLTDKTKKSIEIIKSLLNSKDEIICIVAARNQKLFNPLLQTNKNVKFIKAIKFTDKDKIHLVNDLLKTYPINFDCETTKTNFINILVNDPYSIKNEMQKASNYSLDNEFNTEILDKLINKNTNNSIFDLVKFILLNKKVEALNLLKNLLKKKIQPVICIQIMANQLFDFKLQKMYLLKNNNNIYDINNSLGINQYRIMMNEKILNSTTLLKIKKLLKSLLLLDYNIKNNLVVGEFAIKMLIMES